MGSRMADSEALVTRARKAGWKVIRGSRGYKIYDPLGVMHTVHLTYSDIKSLLNAEQELDRAGLTDAEKAISSARLTESRSRNDIARDAADKRAQKMANGASITRAAGPYLTQAEDVGLDWIISPHPAPWMRWANITPDIAVKIVKDHNADNRPLSPTTVSYYRDIILAGMWHLTHQGLAVDVRGMLQDGQHRLHAVVEAGKLSDEPLVVPFAVFVGMPLENFKAIDEGALRTARQLFTKGGEKNTSALQTCVRLVYYYQDGDARKAARLRLPNQVLLDRFSLDEDGYRAAVQFSATNYLKIPGTSNPAVAASYYLINKVNGDDNEYVDQFFAGLATGLIPGTRTVIDDDDPRRAFRNKMATIKERIDRGDKKERRSALTQVGMIITTWNNMVQTRRIRHLYFNDDNAIPQILRCIPGEGIMPSLFRSPHAQGTTQQ